VDAALRDVIDTRYRVSNGLSFRRVKAFHLEMKVEFCGISTRASRHP
jgi:hypothetical protein